MLCDRASWIALRKRGFPAGSPPPVLAARLISFDSLLKILPRFASIAPLKRLTFDHLLCPAISGVQLSRVRFQKHAATCGREDITKGYSSRARVVCQSRLSHCRGGTSFSGRRVQNAF